MADLSGWGLRLRRLIGRNVVLMLGMAALVTTLLSYMVITRHAGAALGAPRSWVWGLIGFDGGLLALLLAVVVRRALHLVQGLRSQTVGSRLQLRILLLFGMVAVLPTLVVSAFAAFFFNAGIQTWFDTRVSTALEESVVVAEAYLIEHREVLRNTAVAMANELDSSSRSVLVSPGQVSSWLNNEAEQRSLIEAVVIYRNRIVAQSSLSFSMLLDQLPADVQARAERGEVVVFLSEKERVRALIKLHNMPDTYLMVGRLVDNRVLQHMENAQGGVADYRRLQKSVHRLQAMFLALFILVALLLLLAALWYGLVFASRLVIPIGRLINAAERVRMGDYSQPVEEPRQEDDLATLARAFNRMMGDLQTQRGELMEATRQIDARRRFSETVLLGVSAGVIAVDLGGTVALHNRSAVQLLHLGEEANLVGQSLLEVLPPAAHLLARMAGTGERSLQEEATHLAGERQLTLLVRITAERDQDHVSRYIVTFDDITELAVAQRSAAWADVARRVAHEIKNPLTPIHLAMDRLRRKYAKQITDDQETYLRYLDTITKHVSEIGKMVEEFVAFARMPTPVFKEESLHALIRKVIFSESVAHPEIAYETQFADYPITFACDERQLSRAFANLMKNAAETLEARAEGEKGRIIVHTAVEEGKLEIVIADNGPGFPSDKLNRLTEPYVTTREKGTGLGLAIVKKIVEDHGGKLSLRNSSQGGARVGLSFSLNRDINVTPDVAKM